MSEESQQSVGQTKKCPYCVEEIQSSAIKCKHCGSDLQTQQAPAGLQTKSGDIVNPRVGKNLMLGGCLTTIVAFILLGVASSNKIEILSILSSIAIAVGIIMYIVGKVKHWYNWK